MISVEEALARTLAGVPGPVEAERVPLAQARGRTLAEDVAALRTQPPFDTSSMDGYAVRAADVTEAPVRLRVVGRSAAGRGFAGRVGPGEAVRIFTGAPLPAGADAVVAQEEARAEGDRVTLGVPARAGSFLRRRGLDFEAAAVLLRAGERLDARRLALAAAMDHAALPVRRRPRVAILATGDELVWPGEAAGPDQIVASNPFALQALVEAAGGTVVELGLVQDTLEDLDRAVARAREAGADLLVTLGGASVGDLDLVRPALARQGMELGFWRVALRPGKPLLYGRLGPMLMLGLPGNPVSAIVCGLLFVVPALRRLQGDPRAGEDPSEPALLGADLPANDARQDYLRAVLEAGEGSLRATPLPRQDSSMLGALARADALLVRPSHAPPARAGEPCRIIRLDRLG